MSANCEPAFLKRPLILFRPFTVFPSTSCGTEFLNILVRALLLTAVIGAITSYVAQKATYGVMTVTFVSLIAPLVWNTVKAVATGVKSASGSEGFVGTAADTTQFLQFRGPVPDPQRMIAEKGIATVLPSGAGEPWTEPTAANPFMNVLADQYKYDTWRPPAAPYTDRLVKQQIDDFFRVQWFSDPTDVFGRNQGQRQFYTMPSTSIPNDQDSFQKWLYYIPGKTCKEGNGAACLPGTDGGKIPWLNKDA
jgi:hypothetical protein